MRLNLRGEQELDNRRVVFTAACLGMLIFGIVMTTLGPILPSIIERFELKKSDAGSLFLLMSLGMLVGSVVFGPVVDRYGFKWLLTVSAVLVFVGLEGIAFAGSLALLRGAVLLIGFGGGVINGGTNALVAEISKEGRSAGLSILGIFFGLGAFGVPFALGILLERFSYSGIIGSVALLLVALVCFFALVRFPAAKQRQGFPIRQGLGLTKDVTLLLLGSLLFLQSGMEITVSGWTATYLKEGLELADNQAALYFSLFWAGMILARLLLARLLVSASPAMVLKGSIGVALLGAVLLLASQSLVLAVPGIFLVGAGLAAGFPVVLGYVGDRYPELSGTAFSVVLVMALIGGSLLPYLTGAIADATNLRTSLIIIPVSLVCMVILLTVCLRKLKRPD